MYLYLLLFLSIGPFGICAFNLSTIQGDFTRYFYFYGSNPELIDVFDSSVTGLCPRQSLEFYGCYEAQAIKNWYSVRFYNTSVNNVYTNHDSLGSHLHWAWNPSGLNYCIYTCTGVFYRMIPARPNSPSHVLEGDPSIPDIRESDRAVYIFSKPRIDVIGDCCVYMTTRRNDSCQAEIPQTCLLFAVFEDCVLDFDSNVLSYTSCMAEDLGITSPLPTSSSTTVAHTTTTSVSTTTKVPTSSSTTEFSFVTTTSVPNDSGTFKVLPALLSGSICLSLIILGVYI